MFPRSPATSYAQREVLAPLSFRRVFEEKSKLLWAVLLAIAIDPYHLDFSSRSVVEMTNVAVSIDDFHTRRTVDRYNLRLLHFTRFRE